MSQTNCPTCESTKLVPVFACGVPTAIACPDCDGNGFLPMSAEERAASVEKGRRLRRERLDAGFGLREWCLKTGEKPIDRSRAERGISK